MTLVARSGHLPVRHGKSRFPRRHGPLLAPVRAWLEARKAASNSPGVCGGEVTRPMLHSSLDPLHQKLKQLLKMQGEFVLHSLRHTYGTRLGEAGADAGTIRRLRGQSSATVSRRYVHPIPEALERAGERLESFNQRAANILPEGQKHQLPARVSATPPEVVSASHCWAVSSIGRATDS